MQFNLYTNTGAASQSLNNEDSGGEKESLSPRGVFIFSRARRRPAPPRDAHLPDTRINGILAGRESMFSVIAPCSGDSVVLLSSLPPSLPHWAGCQLLETIVHRTVIQREMKPFPPVQRACGVCFPQHTAISRSPSESCEKGKHWLGGRWKESPMRLPETQGRMKSQQSLPASRVQNRGVGHRHPWIYGMAEGSVSRSMCICGVPQAR